MKRIISLMTVIAMPFMASAQDNGYYFDRSSFNVCATIFVIILFMAFILLILKHIFDFRLKNKIVDNGIPENIIASILQTKPKEEDGNVNVKWAAILAGLGLALIIIYYTQPLGIHSLAIMSLSISASFLGYYFFNKHSEK